MTDWDAIYARVITATGWTWDYIDEYLTLPRLNALGKHWQDFPPVNETVAAFVGIKPEKKEPRKIDNAWQGIDTLPEHVFKTLARPRHGVTQADIILPR